MRILCLFKRRYMRKDVIVDRYARLYELPRQLALRGHRARSASVSTIAVEHPPSAPRMSTATAVCAGNPAMWG